MTEYFESIELYEFIKQKDLNSGETQNIISQIIDGFNFLHEKNIVHNDFNIKNILINPISLKIKIIDFGLSQITENYEDSIESPQGNFQFRVPSELCEKWQTGFSIDIWCFCLVVLSILMNKPINSKQAMEFLGKNKRRTPNFASFKEYKQINNILNFMEEHDCDKFSYSLFDFF